MVDVHLTVFISSPSDVKLERARAREVVRTLSGTVVGERRFFLEAMLWEDGGVPAVVGEAAVDFYLGKASAVDLYVGIFWTRLGSPAVIHGKRYESGTRYEFEDAYKRYRLTGRPLMLHYRSGLDAGPDADHAKLAQVPYDPTTFPILRWSWKAIALPTGGDVRKNRLLIGESRNDQALQVLVAFESGNVLSYVWDTTAPVDTEVHEPSIVGTVMTRVVDGGSDQLGIWLRHEVNIVNDHRRRFGTMPGRVVAIIVQQNSNHISSVAEGYFGAITATRGE